MYMEHLVNGHGTNQHSLEFDQLALSMGSMQLQGPWIEHFINWDDTKVHQSYRNGFGEFGNVIIFLFIALANSLQMLSM